MPLPLAPVKAVLRPSRWRRCRVEAARWTTRRVGVGPRVPRFVNCVTLPPLVTIPLALLGSNQMRAWWSSPVPEDAAGDGVAPV